jgi:hypothetical protein
MEHWLCVGHLHVQYNTYRTIAAQFVDFVVHNTSVRINGFISVGGGHKPGWSFKIFASSFPSSILCFVKQLGQKNRQARHSSQKIYHPSHHRSCLTRTWNAALVPTADGMGGNASLTWPDYRTLKVSLGDMLSFRQRYSNERYTLTFIALLMMTPVLCG